MRVPRISLGKLFNVLQSPIGRMALWPMRNIKTFPSKIEGAIWFGLNDLFSSLFPDNPWCPCYALGPFYDKYSTSAVNTHIIW